jgi:hypothetical protein
MWKIGGNMNIRPGILSVIILLTFVMAGCSVNDAYHQFFMRGQVVQVDNDKVVVCLGTQGEFGPGDEYDVFQIVQEGSMADGTDTYHLEMVGAIVLVEIVDEHFARGRITNGTAEVSNEVEARRER